SPEEARGLLSGSIPVEINEAAGTISYEAEFRRKPELPPDPDGKNDDRSAWAAAALAKFMEVTGTDDESAVGDCLADLMHKLDRIAGNGSSGIRLHFTKSLSLMPCLPRQSVPFLA